MRIELDNLRENKLVNNSVLKQRGKKKMTNENNTEVVDMAVQPINGHPILEDSDEAVVQTEEDVGGTEVKPEGVTIH